MNGNVGFYLFPSDIEDFGKKIWTKKKFDNGFALTRLHNGRKGPIVAIFDLKFPFKLLWAQSVEF